MKLLKKALRLITILVIFIVVVAILFLGFEFLLAKIAPQSQLVDCRFLNSDNCNQRTDCYGYTIGGVGGPSAYTCVKKESNRINVPKLNTSTQIGTKTYTNTKFGYSFQYPSNFSYRNGSRVMDTETDDSPIMVLDIGNKNSTQEFFVVVIYKNQPKEDYDKRDYNPFTSSLDSILKTEIGATVNVPMLGTYVRRQDFMFGGKNAFTFENITFSNSDKYFLVDSQKYYYIIFYNSVNEVSLSQVINSFQIK